MEDVIWKDVPGYEGNYIISSDGIIMSTRCKHGARKKNRLVSQSLVGGFHDTFYWGVNLYKDNILKRYLVHRLLALTFIPNPDNKPHVNHIDFDRVNNTLSNLEWVTRRENLSHYFKSKSNKPIGASYTRSHRGKKWAAKLSVLNRTITLGYFDSQEDAGAAYKKALHNINESNCYA